MKRTKLSGLGLLLIWLLLMLPALVMASLPSSSAAQALLGIAAIAIIVALKPYVANTPVRFALMAVGSVIVARYWIWRLTETLPTAGLTISFVLAIILFAVESYSILIFFLNAFITADPTERAEPPHVPFDKLPTVDILVPSYNEPSEMLSVTLAAAKNMIYPRDKRRVVLCDDGGTDSVATRPTLIWPHGQRRGGLN